MKTSRATVALCLGLLGATPALAAEAVKTLRTIFPAAETGFDPATARDLYSAHVTQAIFETLYTYDYLARPARLAPLAAAALPEVSADGKTYTIRLRRGTFFTPDAAFKGRPRALTMADYVFSWKRLRDPHLGTPHAWLFEGKVIGFNQLAFDATKTGRFDIAVMTEDQSRWPSFQSGGADLFSLDGPLAPKALLNGKLWPEQAARGVQLSRLMDPEVTYYDWNMWRKTYTAIGIRRVNERMIFSDLLNAEQLCKVQSRNYQWVTDDPDGDNFMQLYYGPNVHQNNAGCFADPQFDALYAKSQKLPAGLARDALYHQMARRIEVTAASRMGYARYRNMLAQPNVMGDKKPPILKQKWQYIDLDLDLDPSK